MHGLIISSFTDFLREAYDDAKLPATAFTAEHSPCMLRGDLACALFVVAQPAG